MENAGPASRQGTVLDYRHRRIDLEFASVEFRLELPRCSHELLHLADATLALSSAEIAVIGPEAAVNALFAEKLEGTAGRNWS